MVIEQAQHRQPDAITLPITTAHRQIAARFVAQCPFEEKAAQIERNTLAVCAVNAYLQMMGVETDVAASDSWNPMMQSVADVADLNLPGLGSLSCRAVMPDGDFCYVPPEDWCDRIGYVAVVLDLAENQSTLVGFMSAVEEEQIALTRFSPIEALLDRVHAAESSTPSTITRLSQWIEGAVAEGWQTIESVLNPPQTSFAYRSVESAPVGVGRAKVVQLGDQDEQVALVVRASQLSEDTVSVVVQIRPIDGEGQLSEGIILSVFDDGNNLIKTVASRAIDDYMQLQVVGEFSECFSVQVSKGNAAIEEQFEI